MILPRLPATQLAAAVVTLAVLGCGSGKDEETGTPPPTLYQETCPTPTTWFLDSDGDGFGAPEYPNVQCSQPPRHVTNPDDCDDRDPTVGAEGLYFLDRDHDGRAAEDPTYGCPGLDRSDAPQDDCDDDDPAVNVFATEIVNGVDDNCSTRVDDVLPETLAEGSVQIDGAEGPALVVGDLLGWGRPQVLVGTHSPTVFTSKLFDPAVRTLNLANEFEATTTSDVAHVPRAAVDIDGDGIDELLFDTPTSAGLALGPLPDRLEDPTWEWTDTGAANSYDLVVIGDLDSDGTTWLAWSVQSSGVHLLHPLAPGSEDRTGLADLGPAATSLGNGLGSSMDGGGDTDGDGLPELIVGDLAAGGNNEGQAYLLTDHPTGGVAIDLAAAARIDSATAGQRLGQVVAFVGDPNGDGYDDVLIGAQGSASSYLFDGPLPAVTTVATASAVLSGMIPQDATRLGDLDGDGTDDFAVHGIPDGWRLIQGPVAGSQGIEAWPTLWDTGGDIPGSLVRVPDTDGDGTDELLVSKIDLPWPDSRVYILDGFAWP